MSKECKCTIVDVVTKDGVKFKALYDKSRQLLFTNGFTMEFAKYRGWKIEEVKEEQE